MSADIVAAMIAGAAVLIVLVVFARNAALNNDPTQHAIADAMVQAAGEGFTDKAFLGFANFTNDAMARRGVQYRNPYKARLQHALLLATPRLNAAQLQRAKEVVLAMCQAT